MEREREGRGWLQDPGTSSFQGLGDETTKSMRFPGTSSFQEPTRSTVELDGYKNSGNVVVPRIYEVVDDGSESEEMMRDK
jgi:hypothetical protein